MITTSKIKNMLVLMCLSLVMILAGDLRSNLASAQQTSAEEQTISIPPQSSTNVLSSSPGSSVRPPASQNGVPQRTFQQQFYLRRVTLRYGD